MIPPIPVTDVFIPMIRPACFPASLDRSEEREGLNDPIPRGKRIMIKNTRIAYSLSARRIIPIVRIVSQTCIMRCSLRYFRIYFTRNPWKIIEISQTIAIV